MVNHNSPVVIMEDLLVMSKFWHVVAGLYFWEFITTLDYEWSVIRGNRPYRWSIWIYSATRLATLMAIIICLFGLDVAGQYNCQVEIVFQLIFGYSAITAASLLIVLRVKAIWNGKRFALALAAGAWGINVVLSIQTIARVRAVWLPVMDTCLVLNMQIGKINLVATLATDIILILIMSTGLLHMGFHKRSAFGLGHLLWKQGLIWLLVATIAEALPVVLICLNLNAPFNTMFQIPSMVTLTIAATRIYRSLADHAPGSTGLPSAEPDTILAITHNPPKRIEVSIYRTYGQEV